MAEERTFARGHFSISVFMMIEPGPSMRASPQLSTTTSGAWAARASAT